MQIQIIFKLTRPFCVPFNYNYQLQSAVYSKLAEINESDFWHDNGYGEKNKFKAFVLGSLKGNYTIIDKHLCFTDTVSFELRSPVFEFCDAFQRSLELNPHIKLFDTVLDVYGANIINKHINSNSVVFETVTPVVVRSTLPDGYTLYYSPTDVEFVKGIKQNFIKKYSAVYGECPTEIEVNPLGIHKKVVTNYKGTWINAYNGRYELKGDSKSLEFIYNSGLGIKNAQGFGMVRIISE